MTGTTGQAVVRAPEVVRTRSGGDQRFFGCGEGVSPPAGSRVPTRPLPLAALLSAGGFSSGEESDDRDGNDGVDVAEVDADGLPTRAAVARQLAAWMGGGGGADAPPPGRPPRPPAAALAARYGPPFSSLAGLLVALRGEDVVAHTTDGGAVSGTLARAGADLG
jgi:hypothetical protein